LPLARLAAFFSAAAFSTLIRAQRFFVASMILLLPSALSLRLGFEVSLLTACDSFWAAHLFRCASAIALLAATLIFRRRFLAFNAIAVDESLG
jgi:hypothetical protein